MAGASIDYIIPVGSMTLTDQKEYKKKAVRKLLQLAITKNIGDDSDLALLEADKPLQTVDIRDFTNSVLDLVAAPVIDDWQTAALAVVGTNYTCFQAVVSPQLVANKAVVFYGVAIESALVPLPVSRLILRKGGAAGNIVAQFDLEILGTRQEPAGFFTQPVVYYNQDIFAIQARCKTATGAICRVQVWGIVAEPKGSVIA